MSGKQVRLFLVDGTVGGLMTAEIGNWTGHILRGKREKLSELRKRPEAQRTGVYVLLGEDPSVGPGTVAYVGQSDNVAARLANHDQKKDWWTEVLIITSKDLNLTSAHVRYLESRFVALATSIGRTPLTNGNAPTGGAELPEADRSDMEYFIEQVRVLFPVLGVNMFRGQTRRVISAPLTSGGQALTGEADLTEPDGTERSPEFVIQLAKRKVDARARVVDGEFTVLEGSRVAGRMLVPAEGATETTRRQFELRRDIRDSLIQDGSIDVRTDGTAVLSRDVIFSSPSAAACIVLGRGSANGRVKWRTPGGGTYAAWEEADR